MFDKLKSAFKSHQEVARDMRAHPGPPDIASLPPGTASIGGLGAVPADAVSAYVGIEVREVRPLDPLGPESSSLIGDKVLSRLREAGLGDPSLPPGEIIAGQDAAMTERARARGMADEQIAELQAKIVEVATAHQQTGWTVEFTNGNKASVQYFDLDSTDSRFVFLQSKYEAQHTKAGAQAMLRNPTEFAVDLIDNSPYEAYYLPGILSARGRSHEVAAKASHLGTLQLDQTLAALAILTLHSLEG